MLISYDATTSSFSTTEVYGSNTDDPLSRHVTQLTEVNTTTSCPCRCYPSLNTPDMEAKLLQLKKELAVNKTELSSTKRKLTCATDDRPVSAGIGYVGVVLIVIILGILPLFDCLRLLAFLTFKLCWIIIFKIGNFLKVVIIGAERKTMFKNAIKN